MQLLFTRRMKIARCCRYSSAFWFKHKKDCKDVVDCNIGMEVVMSEKKRTVAHWEYSFQLLSLLHEFHEEIGLQLQGSVR